MDENSAPLKRKLLADGPKTIREFNPKAILRFSDRYCETCNVCILDHYLIATSDPEKVGSYFCDVTGDKISTGLKV